MKLLAILCILPFLFCCGDTEDKKNGSVQKKQAQTIQQNATYHVDINIEESGYELISSLDSTSRVFDLAMLIKNQECLSTYNDAFVSFEQIEDGWSVGVYPLIESNDGNYYVNAYVYFLVLNNDIVKNDIKIFSRITKFIPR